MTIYQLVRLLVFINTYDGVEHDSGWFLGVARSLTETGTYTSLVNTMPHPEIKAGPDINQEFFQVQDDSGRIYFFIEGTVGPTQVFADALVIKLFGSGFWQFRTASLFFYFGFLVLASWMLFLMGGFWATFLLHGVLFFYPHLSVFLGYESLGEIPMVTCVLFSFLFFAMAATSEKYRVRYFLLSGLLAGLAVMAKVIALLSLTSLVFLWMILFFRKKVNLQEGIITFLGSISLPLISEVVQMITITRLFGFDNYLRHAQQGLNFFVSGSGIEGETGKGMEFLLYKTFLISEISHPNRVLSFMTLIVIAVGGMYLIWHFRKNRLYQYLATLIWGGWLIHTLWFILRAENGWVRRYWLALILGGVLLSLLWSVLLKLAQKTPNWVTVSLAVVLTGVIGLNLYGQKHVATFFISDHLVDDWYQKHLAAPQTQLPSIIIPRAQQNAAVVALAQVSASGRVFYPENYKSAELAALSGRIFYPIQQRQLMPAAPGDVMIIGPNVISPWRKPHEAPISQAEQQTFVNGLREEVRRTCPQIILENDYYMICALD